MASPTLRDALGQVVFAAADAMGAVAGVQRLRGLGWAVSAFTGLVTASPLAASEAQAVLRSVDAAVPCCTRDDLRNPLVAARLLGVRRAELPLAA
jgi:hypothetical protein